MRRMQLLFGVALGSAAVIVACGGSTNEGGGQPDASTPDTSVADSAKPDVADAAPIEDSAVACSIDADLGTIAPDDAALGEAGSVGTCIACTRSSCASQVTACNGNCQCNNLVVCIYDCLSKPSAQLIACATGCAPGGLTSLPPGGQELLFCAAGACQVECNAPSIGPKPDASAGDASSSDASSSDAASEGG